MQGLRFRISDLGFLRALICRFAFGFFLRRAESNCHPCIGPNPIMKLPAIGHLGDPTAGEDGF